MGPFEARHDGQHIEVGTRRQERCLLGILLLDADRMVPVTRLIDLLWNGDAPESARGAVHTYIGRLRNSLQQYGLRILTLGEGYLAEVAPHTVDTTEFTRVAQQAAAVAEPAERIRLLDQALDLWRGPLLSDVADDRLRGRLGTGLLELRLSSSELRAAAHLATGQHDRVVTDLIPLAAEHPTRERLIAHLMTGLYRCGRQAEALELYRDTRQTLVSELGIEPGPELGELHQRILRNEPDLLRKTPAPVYAVQVRGHYLPWHVGGHPALEFCNTYAGWGRPPMPGSEWLRGYSTLAVWTGYMDLADEPTVTRLVEEARRTPDEAAVVLHEARTLRTQLYAYLTDPGNHAAFEVVARYVEAAARVSVFRRDDDGLGQWSLTPGAGLRIPLHAAARAAADLLTDPRRYTVRACPSEHCGWLFLDQTGMRKWCSLATCGLAAQCVPSQA